MVDVVKVWAQGRPAGMILDTERYRMLMRWKHRLGHDGSISVIDNSGRLNWDSNQGSSPPLPWLFISLSLSLFLSLSACLSVFLLLLLHSLSPLSLSLSAFLLLLLSLLYLSSCLFFYVSLTHFYSFLSFFATCSFAYLCVCVSLFSLSLKVLFTLLLISSKPQGLRLLNENGKPPLEVQVTTSLWEASMS